ncbi:response regulator transcription factor [Falsibacillus pallidus]|uniref:response regulator transcription factor n=1 Tax=Falsibacillus pallidus TaxID=493781 RepID=UPI003D983F41
MKKILLAEDEEVLRMLVLDTLEDEDYDVYEAADGNEAFDLIQQQEFDLLILDYMMPGYTGLELIQMVRAGKSNKDAKILMLSAKSQQYEQEIVKNAGADHFICKPFSPLQLLEKIGEILS